MRSRPGEDGPRPPSLAVPCEQRNAPFVLPGRKFAETQGVPTETLRRIRIAWNEGDLIRYF